MTHMFPANLRGLLGVVVFAAAAAVFAQEEGPAVDTSNLDSERPAVEIATDANANANAERPSESASGEQAGTVIVGDRESPIGLYIMPWRDSSAAADMDRPARLVEANLLPIDRPVFLQELQYHRALSGALAERNQVTPDVPIDTP